MTTNPTDPASGITTAPARGRLRPRPLVGTASGGVVVQLQRDFNDATLCVFSTDGTRVLTIPIDGNQATIPVSALANGLYHVVVRPAIGSPSTSLLVIQR